MILPSLLVTLSLDGPDESPTARVQRGSSEAARCASTGDSPGLPPLLADFFSILLDLPQSHWPVGLAGLLEFLHMAAEGWAEFGGEDCFSVGRDVVLDLSIASANCLTSRWPEPVSHLRCQLAYSKSWIE